MTQDSNQDKIDIQNTYSRVLEQLRLKRRLLAETQRAKKEADEALSILKAQLISGYCKKELEVKFRYANAVRQKGQILNLINRLLSSIDTLEIRKEGIERRHLGIPAAERQKIEEKDF